MYCLDYAKYLRSRNQVSFLLHELYSWGIIRGSLRIRTDSLRIFLYSCKILRPYGVVTIRMHSDAVLSSMSCSSNKKNKN